MDIFRRGNGQGFSFDLKINWIRNHAVEVALLWEAQNTEVALVEKLAKNLMRIYSLKKLLSSTIQPSLHVEEDAYLTAIPYEPKRLIT